VHIHDLETRLGQFSNPATGSTSLLLIQSSHTALPLLIWQTWKAVIAIVIRGVACSRSIHRCQLACLKTCSCEGSIPSLASNNLRKFLRFIRRLKPDPRLSGNAVAWAFSPSCSGSGFGFGLFPPPNHATESEMTVHPGSGGIHRPLVR